MNLTIKEEEYSGAFKPFIKLKLVKCTNETCNNMFSLTDAEILSLVNRKTDTYQLLITGEIDVTCPLCNTTQIIKSKDLIGEYLGEPVAKK